MLTGETLDSMLTGETIISIVTEETVDSILTEEAFDSTVTEETLDSMLTEETLDSIVMNQTLDSIVTEQAFGSIVTEETLDSILSEKTLDSMLTEETRESIAMNQTFDSMVTEQAFGSIVTEETLDSILTEEALGSIVTEETLGFIISNETLGSSVTEQALVATVTDSVTEQALVAIVTDSVTEQALVAIVTDSVTEQSLVATVTDSVTEQALVATVTDSVTEQALVAIVTDSVTEQSLVASVTDSVTEQALVAIVTDSVTEQVITVGLLLAFWLYVNLTNGFLLYVMKKVRTLNTPQYMILGFYMVCDVLNCNFQLLVIVPTTIQNSMAAIHVVVCRVLITASASFFFACIHLVGLIAYERYSYFITPLKYPMKFTKVRIYTSTTIIYLVAFCISLAVELISPRVPVSTVMSCRVNGPYAQNVIFLFAFYMIPSGLMSVVTLIKLRLMITKHTVRVDALPQAFSDDQSAIHGLIVKPIKKALRMVSLVSGSFWLTTMPGAVIRLSLSATGVTWLDTDHRTSILLLALARASYFLISLVSSILNPIIYITVLPDIREAIWKCMGIKQEVTEH